MTPAYPPSDTWDSVTRARVQAVSAFGARITDVKSDNKKINEALFREMIETAAALDKRIAGFTFFVLPGLVDGLIRAGVRAAAEWHLQQTSYSRARRRAKGDRSAPREKRTGAA